MHTNGEETVSGFVLDRVLRVRANISVGLIDTQRAQRALEKSIGFTAVGLPDDLRERGVTQPYASLE